VLETRSRNYWWLVALEAASFVSLPCWELTAIWAAPVSHPFRFGVSLLVTASVAMYVCHVGPALFAARFGKRRPLLSWVLLIWLSLGYIEWLGSMALTLEGIPEIVPGWLRNQGNWSGLTVAVAFLAVVMTVTWVIS
jgi:hypothetical protein